MRTTIVTTLTRTQPRLCFLGTCTHEGAQNVVVIVVVKFQNVFENVGGHLRFVL
jgi:hypothetical protein